MKKLEYLEFEKKYYYDINCKKENRKKYGITEEEVKAFYGNEYIDINYKSKNKNKKNNKRFSKDEVIEQLDLFKEIFDTNDDAFIRIRCKATGEYYSYNINSIFLEEKLYSILNSDRFSTKEDLMYSLNLYNNMRTATEENLFSIHSIAIDVDFDEVKRFSDKKPLDIIKILEKNDFNKTIPKPNIIEYGNRIRLIYKLEKVYCTKSSKALAKRVSKVIGERLVDYGAKAQPLTTYGRIINSVNSKVNKKIKVMYLDVQAYKLRDLQKNWLNPLPDWYAEWKVKTKRKKAKVIAFKEDFQERGKARKYNLNRVNDFFKIQEFFNYHCDGRRFLCYQVRNHCILSGMSKEEAKEVLREFNNRFTYPLKWNVIEQDTRNVERKQYYYKSETILDFMQIDPKQEEVMQLKAILSDTEVKRRNNEYNKEKQKAKYRDEEGLTKTEVKRRNQFILIARMELEGMSFNAISKELGYKDHTPVIKKVNKLYDKINYQEIKLEVKQGLYDDVEVAI